MAKLTINEMILKTISTKLNKEPKYKEILEAMGYIVFDSEWSSYNNWSVGNKNNNRLVVLSKGYDNKKRLYGGGSPIKTNDFRKVDYVGYLNCNRIKYYTPYFNDKGVETKYSKLRYSMKHTKQMIEVTDGIIENLQSRINDLTTRLEKEQKSKNGYLKELTEIRKEITELKK